MRTYEYSEQELSYTAEIASVVLVTHDLVTKDGRLTPLRSVVLTS